MIDGSAKQTAAPPMSFIISVGKILEFAATIDENPVLSKMAESLKDAAGKDKVSSTAKAIDRGIRYRFEVGESVLGLIGEAQQSQF